MKKIILPLLSGALLLAFITPTQAQLVEETVALKVVKKGEEPKSVIESIKRDFPDSKIDQLAVLPRTLANRKWAITRENGNLDGTQPDFYEVSAKGRNEQFQAVYNRSGQLISFTERIKNTQLPAPVRQMLADKYPDWTIAADHELIKYRNGQRNAAYRVRLEKGKARKHATIKEESGEIAILQVF